MNKKIVLSLLIIFVLASALPIFASNDKYEADMGNQITDSNILDKLNINVLPSDEYSLRRSVSSNTFDENHFGGIYIEGDEVILQFVKNTVSLEKSIKHLSGSSVDFNENGQYSVKIEAVDNSEVTLMEIHDILAENMHELGISTLGVDVFSNKEEIGIILNDDESFDDCVFEIVNYLEENALDFNGENYHDVLIFHEITQDDLPDLIPTSLDDADGRPELRGGNVGLGHLVNNGADTATVSFRAVGSNGFITTGHAFRNGQTIYQGRSTANEIGVVKRVTHNGSDDSAYVEFTNNTTYYKPLNEAYISSYPTVGSTYSMSGGISGTRSGTIVKNTYTYTYSGRTWSNLIQANISVQG